MLERERERERGSSFDNIAIDDNNNNHLCIPSLDFGCFFLGGFVRLDFISSGFAFFFHIASF